MTSVVKNQLIVQQLERLILQTQYHDLIDPNPTNKFRLHAFRMAVSKIKFLDIEITNGAHARSHGIGFGVAKRIDQILTTGQLSEVDIDPDHFDQMKVVEKIVKIPGLDWIKAHQIVNKYWSSAHKWSADKIVIDLCSDLKSFSWETQLGLKYWSDLQIRIPRSEIDQVKTYLNKNFQNIDFEICGSYRRLKESSGDIDVLWVLPNNITNTSDRLLEIVQKLSGLGFLIDHITGFASSKTNIYRGYCRILDIVRRIDFLIVNESQRASALLYFTGSSEFNRKLRIKSLNMNYLLNQYGLFNRSTGHPIKSNIASESEIFELLEEPYVEPSKR